jgi:hypothetical protein
MVYSKCEWKYEFAFVLLKSIGSPAFAFCQGKGMFIEDLKGISGHQYGDVIEIDMVYAVEELNCEQYSDAITFAKLMQL